MTQPPAPDDNGHVLAVAAIGLALIAVEARVRQQVHEDIAAALKIIAAAAILTASTAPATVITGVALLSIASLHKAITGALDNAHTKTTGHIEAGYTAAGHVAHTKITAELAAAGYTVPDTIPTLDNNLDMLLADIDTMFGHAQTDLQANIAHGFDSSNDPAARIVGINTATTNAGNRLQNRAAATAGVAVQQGAGDTQQALYNEYQNATGTAGLMKRWVVTSATPCGMCAALNGTMVGINAEFDHNATTVDKDLRRVWRNLYAPPRHPNCRCQLELVKT